jgi:carbon monoxide dehydrogenase subunit G
MLHFEGDQQFRQPVAEIAGKLADARFLVGCIPQGEAEAQAEAARATCTIRPGFAFARGTLQLTMEISDIVKDTSARVLMHSKGIGSSSTVEALLTFAAGSAGGTNVHWTADIKELGGLLKAVPQGLIKAAAQKVIADAWTAIEAKLST